MEVRSSEDGGSQPGLHRLQGEILSQNRQTNIDKLKTSGLLTAFLRISVCLK